LRQGNRIYSPIAAKLPEFEKFFTAKSKKSRKIKQVMGFWQFLLRGLEKVNLEWEIVCLGYNMKRLFRLSPG
jgi:hypothetical protein